MMKIVTFKGIANYFGFSDMVEFWAEYDKLSLTDKNELESGLANGTYTY